MNIQSHEILFLQHAGVHGGSSAQEPGEPGKHTLQSIVETLPDLSSLTFAAPPVSEEEAIADHLLKMGQEAVEQGDWEGADQALSRARDIRIDQPLTLAWLAWARLHNEAIPGETRAKDALAMAILALQLSPEDMEVRSLVSEVFSRQGERRAS